MKEWRVGSWATRVGVAWSAFSWLGPLHASCARACAVCATGDTTLTSAGTEQPFAGRLRSAFDLRYRTNAFGRAGVDETRIREFAAELSTAWAPSSDWLLLVTAPFRVRQMTDANLTRDGSSGFGDVELSAKWFVFRDREFAPRWLVAVLVATQLPTGRWYEDAEGAPLPPEAQPGSGSLDVGTGASVGCFLGAFSGYASWVWRTPVLSKALFEPGRATNVTFALQYQALPSVGVRGVSELRWDGTAREAAARDPNSGGWISFVGADILVGVAEDLSFLGGVRVPALERLRGAQREGPRLDLAVVRDW
jgi:hypothetical protein